MSLVLFKINKVLKIIVDSAAVPGSLPNPNQAVTVPKLNKKGALSQHRKVNVDKQIKFQHIPGSQRRTWPSFILPSGWIQNYCVIVKHLSLQMLLLKYTTNKMLSITSTVDQLQKSMQIHLEVKDYLNISGCTSGRKLINSQRETSFTSKPLYRCRQTLAAMWQNQKQTHDGPPNQKKTLRVTK